MKAIFAGLTLALLTTSCDLSNGCEEAMTAIETEIQSICQEAAYKGSPFCVCCVQNRLLSVDDTCSCRGLIFDTEECYYATDNQAAPQARAAVAFANNVCTNRAPLVPLADAGSPQCTVEVNEGGAPAASSSASNGRHGSVGGE